MIRNADALERSYKIQTVVLDKTGTLTRGQIAVTDVLLSNGTPSIGEDELMRLAASAERDSEHPLGAAVVADAMERGLTLQPVSQFQALPATALWPKLTVPK